MFALAGPVLLVDYLVLAVAFYLSGRLDQLPLAPARPRRQLVRMKTESPALLRTNHLRVVLTVSERESTPAKPPGASASSRGRTSALTWKCGQGHTSVEPEVADGYRRSQRRGIFDHSCDVEHPFS
jgi:hypothetical protein